MYVQASRLKIVARVFYQSTLQTPGHQSLSGGFFFSLRTEFRPMTNIYQPFLILFLTLAVSMTAYGAAAHSGGTDARGCHAGSQPYHCH